MNTNDTNGDTSMRAGASDPSMGEPVSNRPEGPQEFWIVQYATFNENIGQLTRKDIICGSLRDAQKMCQRLGVPENGSPFHRVVHVREVVV